MRLPLLSLALLACPRPPVREPAPEAEQLAALAKRLDEIEARVDAVEDRPTTLTIKTERLEGIVYVTPPVKPKPKQAAVSAASKEAGR